MKQKLSLFLSFLVLAASAFAQNDKSFDKRRMFGIHFNSMDVNTPQVWKDNSGPKTLAGFKEQDLGFSLSYWQTVAHNVDLSLKTSLMFHNYSSIDRDTYTTNYNQMGAEVEPTVNLFAFNSKSSYNAFATVGAGVGYYSGKFGAYAPAGAGLMANLSNETFIMIQAQYRFTLMKDVLKDNLLYSIGITQNIGEKKKLK